MKLISLTQGKFAKVDDQDYDFLMQWKWHTKIRKNGKFYAERCTGRNKKILMHRQILNLTDPKILIDHIDRDPLNNQRSNIRTATYSQNGANRDSSRNGTSKYLGVHFEAASNKFRAKIQINKKDIHIGRFTSEIEAAKAYNEAAQKYHGEFANLNKVN